MLRRSLLKAGLSTPFILTMTKASRAQQLRVRTDVMELPEGDEFFSKYALAVKKMHDLPETDPRSWRSQSIVHANYCPHGKIDFVHWHRHYITYFERICGGLIGDPSFALPYWNWTKNSGKIPDPFYKIRELNVEYWKDRSDYQADNWSPDPITTIARRGLQQGKGLQDNQTMGKSFTAQTIQAISRLSNFSQFWRATEGTPHNDGHVVAGALPDGQTGHIGDGLSPLDPIFWLHHCMVDKMWAEWQAAQNVTPDPGKSYSGQFVDEGSNPVNDATAKSAFNHTKLGFTYDILQQIGGPLIDILKATLDAEEQSKLSKEFATAEVKTLALLKNDSPSVTDIVTSFEIPVLNLDADVLSTRVYRPLDILGLDRFAQENARILAHFSNVIPPEKTGASVVNVFVECSYLSPNTPSSDPHYAGTFSFFGKSKHMAEHGYEFLIDITEPLRSKLGEGRLRAGSLNLQVVPVAIGDAKIGSNPFKIGTVELVSA